MAGHAGHFADAAECIARGIAMSQGQDEKNAAELSMQTMLAKRRTHMEQAKYFLMCFTPVTEEEDFIASSTATEEYAFCNEIFLFCKHAYLPSL